MKRPAGALPPEAFVSGRWRGRCCRIRHAAGMTARGDWWAWYMPVDSGMGSARGIGYVWLPVTGWVCSIREHLARFLPSSKNRDRCGGSVNGQRCVASMSIPSVAEWARGVGVNEGRGAMRAPRSRTHRDMAGGSKMGSGWMVACLSEASIHRLTEPYARPGSVATSPERA